MPNDIFGSDIRFNSPYKSPSDADTSKLLMQMQQSVAAMEAARARAARGAGGAGPAMAGDWLLNPQTGEYEFVVGKDKETRALNRASAQMAQMNKYMAEHPDEFEDLQKAMTGESSNKLSGEVIDKFRREKVPSLVAKTGIGADAWLNSELFRGATNTYNAKKQALAGESSIGLTAKSLGQGAINLLTGIGNIGAMVHDMVTDGDWSQSLAKWVAEDEEEHVNNSEFLQEQRKREQEGEGVLDRLSLLGAVTTAAENIPALAAMAIPGTLGARGVATLSRAALAARSAAAGAVAFGGQPGLALNQRIQAQEGKTDEQKRQEMAAVAPAALAGGMALGAGVMPIVQPLGRGAGAALARAGIRLPGAGYAAEAAARRGVATGAIAPEAAEKAISDAVAQDVANAQSRGFLRRYLTSGLPAAAVEGSALMGGQQVGTNYLYNQATGENVPVTEGLGDAVASALIAAPFFGLGMSHNTRVMPERAPRAQANEVGPVMTPTFNAEFAQRGGVVGEKFTAFANDHGIQRGSEPYNEILNAMRDDAAKDKTPEEREATLSKWERSVDAVSAQNRNRFAELNAKGDARTPEETAEMQALAQGMQNSVLYKYLSQEMRNNIDTVVKAAPGTPAVSRLSALARKAKLTAKEKAEAQKLAQKLRESPLFSHYPEDVKWNINRFAPEEAQRVQPGETVVTPPPEATEEVTERPVAPAPAETGSVQETAAVERGVPEATIEGAEEAPVVADEELNAAPAEGVEETPTNVVDRNTGIVGTERRAAVEGEEASGAEGQGLEQTPVEVDEGATEARQEVAPVPESVPATDTGNEVPSALQPEEQTAQQVIIQQGAAPTGAPSAEQWTSVPAISKERQQGFNNNRAVFDSGRTTVENKVKAGRKVPKNSKVLAAMKAMKADAEQFATLPDEDQQLINQALAFSAQDKATGTPAGAAGRATEGASTVAPAVTTAGRGGRQKGATNKGRTLAQQPGNTLRNAEKNGTTVDFSLGEKPNTEQKIMAFNNNYNLLHTQLEEGAFIHPEDRAKLRNTAQEVVNDPHADEATKKKAKGVLNQLDETRNTQPAQSMADATLNALNNLIPPDGLLAREGAGVTMERNTTPEQRERIEAIAKPVPKEFISLKNEFDSLNGKKLDDIQKIRRARLATAMVRDPSFENNKQISKLERITVAGALDVPYYTRLAGTFPTLAHLYSLPREGKFILPNGDVINMKDANMEDLRALLAINILKEQYGGNFNTLKNRDDLHGFADKMYEAYNDVKLTDVDRKMLEQTALSSENTEPEKIGLDMLDVYLKKQDGSAKVDAFGSNSSKTECA